MCSRAAALEFTDSRAGELHRKRLGLALREIDKNVSDIVGLGSEIDAGDNVGLVFCLGQPRRLCVGGVFRERIDGRALGLTFAARQGIGMHRDEKRRAA